jgi:LacI family transcriptional regulator
LLEDHPSLTAVFVSSDVLCTGVTQAVRDRGMQIPLDISIVSILSSRFAEVVSPPITAVELPAAEMGRIGTEMLIRRLEGHADAPKQLVLAPHLVLRHSTAAPREESL